MSIFNELILPKILEIQNQIAKHFDDELKASLESGDKLEEEFLKSRAGIRSKARNEKSRMTTLQSIHEDEDEPSKTKESKADDEAKAKKRVSKKRSKEEVDGMSSPEVDKRQKRNASVKAQSIISKQSGRDILKELSDNDEVIFVSHTRAVNVSLTQKMRREGSTDKSRKGRCNDENKENAHPLPVLQIKLEKISLPPEVMDMESLPVNIEIKSEPNKDDIAMPPPVAPVPKPRKALQKEKSAETSEDESRTKKRGTRGRKATETIPQSADSSEDESGTKKRGTRGRKATETMPPPPEPSARSTRASSRTTRQMEETKPDEVPPASELPESRPKRTRGRKKVSEVIPTEPVKETAAPQENGIGSPSEKPRPKRTRRAQKAAEKESQSSQEGVPEPTKQQITTKETQIAKPEPTSPLLQQKVPKPSKNTKKINEEQKPKANQRDANNSEVQIDADSGSKVVLNETRVIEHGDMDKTMVLQNGVYNHAPETPKSVNAANETVVLEVCNRQTLILHSQTNTAMDATVVLDKVSDSKPTNVTDDNSLLTDDSEPEMRTPPKSAPPAQPTSAVKEKVQQFEELAARTTRTKTRAMAKLEEPENNTPPDKIINPVLSAETLSKMNSMIFNGKPPQQISNSASKPRVIPPPKVQPSSTSKLSSISRHRDAAEEAKREKEDARKKKEAMLEAKRELQKKKREDKMAAAAAAREAAERERRLALQQVARERMEKQAHADLGKLERLKEVERKKQEVARKLAEMEERRRAEEQARQQRLAEEQRKAEAARRKQLEEAEAMKKEAVLMAKEMEKRQKEYFEKQKMHKMHTPLKTPGTPGYYPQEPVYMADGFEHLNSDEEAESPPQKPVPAWSSVKMRKLALIYQSEVDTKLIDTLFSVRVHSVDLREIFPNIDRNRLKRTSSAVWRTPPSRLPALHE